MKRNFLLWRKHLPKLNKYKFKILHLFFKINYLVKKDVGLNRLMIEQSKDLNNNNERQLKLKDKAIIALRFRENNLILERVHVSSLNYLVDTDNLWVAFYDSKHSSDKFIDFYFAKFKNFLIDQDYSFYLEYRVVGLGFKIKRSSFKTSRSLILDIGFSHIIKYVLPDTVKILKGKRKFFLVSSNLQHLYIVAQHLHLLRVLNPYKIRGLKRLDKDIKMKAGKKQTHK